MEIFSVKHISTKAIFACCILIIFSACVKEGPAGPTGPAGPAGPQGPPGTSNQVTQISVSLANWTPLSGSPGQWMCSANIPTITQNALNNGNIFLYWTQGGTQTLLPFTTQGIDFMYISGLLNGTGAIQVFVTKVGAYATVPPSYYNPVVLKVIVQP